MNIKQNKRHIEVVRTIKTKAGYVVTIEFDKDTYDELMAIARALGLTNLDLVIRRALHLYIERVENLI